MVYQFIDTLRPSKIFQRQISKSLLRSYIKVSHGLLHKESEGTMQYDLHLYHLSHLSLSEI